MLGRQIENIPKKTKKNLLSYIASFYDYPEGVHQPAVFHFLVEAWLLTIMKQYRNKLIKDCDFNYESKTFSEILSFISSEKTSKQTFYSFYKKLVSSECLAELRFSNTFVDKIETIKKNEIFVFTRAVSQKQRNGFPVEINKVCFENVMKRIFMKAVNLTVNEINISEKEKESYFLYNTFNSVFADQKKRSFSLEESPSIMGEKRRMSCSKSKDFAVFKEKVTRNMKSKALKNDPEFYLHLSKLFYDFSSTQINELIDDVRHFIFRKSSPSQKIWLIIRNIYRNKKNKFFRFFFGKCKYINYLSSKYSSYIKSIVELYIKKIKSFLIFLKNKVYQIFKLHYNIFKYSSNISFSLVNSMLSIFKLQLVPL